MKLGLRGRLVLASALLLALVGVVGGLFLERYLRSWFDTQVEVRLMAAASAGRELVEGLPGPVSTGALQPVAEHIAEGAEARITVVATDGRVLADSELAPREVAEVENHGDRPEVEAALVDGRGTARRYSATLDLDMLYVAVRFERADEGGVVRAALPLRAVASVVRNLRWLLLVGGLVALAVTVLLIWLASHFLSRELRALVTNAQAIARGETPRRLPVARPDELGGLAGSFNRLADQLENSVRTLVLERDRFEAILEGMSEGVVAVDERNRVTLVNSAALNLLDLASAPTDEPLDEVIPVGAIGVLVSEARHVGFGRSEIDLPGPPARTLLGQATPQRTTEGVVVVLHDVTDLRRLETIRRDFVANVSHELQTPVSIIMANAETLLDGTLLDDDRERAVDFLEAVQRNAVRISRIVADLLDISRIEAGAYKVEARRLPLCIAVSRIVQAMAPVAEERELTLRANIDPEIEVLAEAKALDQVLLNLLDNAVKYTPDGGEVEVTARLDDDRVIVEVRDTGAGIAPEHRARIFERFYRVDVGRSREMGGTGLGLAIAKHLVGALDGELGMRPNEPHGSVFWFTVPRA